jgi:hypothetical protein
MICPVCGSVLPMHQMSQLMRKLAQRPRRSIVGTPAAKERARKVATG